jgi:hypothetical protein
MGIDLPFLGIFIKIQAFTENRIPPHAIPFFDAFFEGKAFIPKKQ